MFMNENYLTYMVGILRNTQHRQKGSMEYKAAICLYSFPISVAATENISIHWCKSVYDTDIKFRVQTIMVPEEKP